MPIDRAGATRALAVVIGAVVIVFVAARLTAPTLGQAHLLRYHLGDTDRQVVVTYGRGACDTVNEVRAEESAASVRLSVVVVRPRGTCTANIVFDDAPITLGSALGDRDVTDADGTALPLGSL